DPRQPLRSESDCAKWIRELLAEEALPGTEVIRLAAAFGFSNWKVQRVSRQINVKKKRNKYGEGSKVIWSMGKGLVTAAMRITEDIKRDFEASGIENMRDEPADELHDEPVEDDRDGDVKLAEDMQTDEPHGAAAPREEQGQSSDERREDR